MTTRIATGVGANLLGQHSAERNQDATAYVGNLDPVVPLPPHHFLLADILVGITSYIIIVIAYVNTQVIFEATFVFSCFFASS